MTQAGFWRNLTATPQQGVTIASSFGLINKTYFLFPQGGGPRGAAATFAEIKPQLRNRDCILMSGVLREQAIMPDDIYDISFIGAANQARQATSGGTPTGGGATWMPPSSGAVATTALLGVVRQACTFVNISFTPHTSSPAISLVRHTTTDAIDSSHAAFINCLFGGQGGSGQVGLQNENGAGQILVEGCRFMDLASGLLSVATGAAVPLAYIIRDNTFMRNTNDIKMSLSYSQILGNRFLTAGSGSTNKVISTTFISTQGGNNQILLNFFNNTEAQIAPSSGYTGASSDLWLNYVNDQAAIAYGQPA